MTKEVWIIGAVVALIWARYFWAHWHEGRETHPAVRVLAFDDDAVHRMIADKGYGYTWLYLNMTAWLWLAGIGLFALWVTA